MSFVSLLSPSPVAAAFAGIEWDPLNKLRLSEPEKATLRAAEANPLDYTLADRAEAAAYARVLLKVLSETVGPSGPSSRVSQVKETLPDAEALQMLYTDSTGVVTHYTIAKLYEIVVCLKEKTSGSGVSIATTFYNDNGLLIDDWRPLLRVLHLGGSGDAFAQSESSCVAVLILVHQFSDSLPSCTGGSALILSYILMEGCASQRKRNANDVALKYASVQEPLQALVSWIASQLQSSSGTSLSLVIPSLMALMACPEARALFHDSGGIGYLSRHLRMRQNNSNHKRKTPDAGASVQQLYELCFCMWTLTYECNTSAAVRAHFARDGAVGALVDLVAAAPREKVVRVAISALRNLATCTANDTSGRSSGRRVVNSSYFLTEMIGCGLIRSIDRMKERQWTDPDILEGMISVMECRHGKFYKSYFRALHVSQI